MAGVMLNSHLRFLFAIAAVLVVGGWGFLTFRYPDGLARIIARLGLPAFSSPKYISLMKQLGIFGMALAIVSLIDLLVTSAFGGKW